MSCFFIAEAGVNHNGQLDLALELIEIAAECGADAIKFQSFKAEKLVTSGTKKAEYQKNNTGGGDQLSMLKKLEMSEKMHQVLFEKCQKEGVEFMSTPFDESSADFLVDLGIKRIKIPSGEITNHPFIAHLASKNLPLIMSTGMSNMQEILEAVAIVENVRKEFFFDGLLSDNLTILHCTSNYPADCKDVNLRAMTTIAEKTKLPVGYSDHTLGVAVSTAAVARGALIIEKHFTLDRSMEGPDHKASLEKNELLSLIKQIKDVEKALGSSIKEPTESELPIRDLVRKSAAATRNLKKGHVLSARDIELLRPGYGIKAKEIKNVIGKILNKDIDTGSTLFDSDIS